jgi:hypothetical protein
MSVVFATPVIVVHLATNKNVHRAAIRLMAMETRLVEIVRGVAYVTTRKALVGVFLVFSALNVNTKQLFINF